MADFVANGKPALSTQTFTRREWWWSWWRGVVFGASMTVAILSLTGHLS